MGISTPRTRILLSSAYTPPRPYPRTMVISCVSPGGVPSPPHPSLHYLPMYLCYVRARLEGKNALTESVSALSVRAHERSL